MHESLTKINGVDITTVEHDGAVYVPVKPICAALGVSYSGQLEKLRDDPTFAESVVRLSRITGADGKQYEMACLPLLLVFLWLGSINPKNVSEEARPAVIRYRLECAQALFNHFVGRMQRAEDANEQERRLVQELNDAATTEKECREHRKDLEHQLDQLRRERLNPQPQLF